MSALVRPVADADAVLAKALLNTREQLGLTQQELANIVGVHRTAITRWADSGLRPQSKTGELALLLIRAYRALFALFGGNLQDMRHFLRTENRHLAGVPLALMVQVQGLVHVVEYLDAIRGKV
ncbi:MbcA/ParS/Xre antitoxin family protein [Pseudomonas sp. UBA2684]|uniref:MbcA/ParS/Xre antitoxin family protein n=1 Tax=Pseudomonas sp. UBA2684 TaxID=1947311 RepID=UPI000E825258|nr:antitoxin Xre/MbcA/ParS toxin-binding domain-containing protein [Pseudomonas sp. UBA2684]HBX54191.1 XRE family transcriptional regulator [Pseudomonas sp.]|tara:strand:- start:3354 stop:3722 length:369 start_codon:yes stop_codon:yes gene_type:complete